MMNKCDSSKIVSVEKLVFGGYGLAHTDQGVMFVESAAPGDSVCVTQSGKRGGVPIGKIDSFARMSPLRRTPPCPYVGICGGCDWQHLHYKAQVEAKKSIFEECLERIGRISTIPAIEVFESPEFGYRSRAQLKIDTHRPALGFFKRQSNDVVAVASCPLLSPGIDNILKNSARILGELPDDCRGIKAIEGDGNRVATHPAISDLTFSHTTRTVSGISFSIEGDGFFQSNHFMLQTLGHYASIIGKGKFLIDMYGGVGFFAAHAASLFESGILVESVPGLTRKAQHTFQQNGMTHLEAVTVSAEAFFKKQHYRRYPHPDGLIIDPPRPGLTRVVREGIAEMLPEKILYISCNPSTQARDAGFFLNKCGYKLHRAAIFDLYPQTHHIETALLLAR